MLGIGMMLGIGIRALIARRRVVALVFRLLLAWGLIAVAGICGKGACLELRHSDRVLYAALCVACAAAAVLVTGSFRSSNPLPKAKVVR